MMDRVGETAMTNKILMLGVLYAAMVLFPILWAVTTQDAAAGPLGYN